MTRRANPHCLSLRHVDGPDPDDACFKCWQHETVDDSEETEEEG